jgi:hypothetical protein
MSEDALTPVPDFEVDRSIEYFHRAPADYCRWMRERGYGTVPSGIEVFPKPVAAPELIAEAWRAKDFTDYLVIARDAQGNALAYNIRHETWQLFIMIDDMRRVMQPIVKMTWAGYLAEYGDEGGAGTVPAHSWAGVQVGAVVIAILGVIAVMVGFWVVSAFFMPESLPQ